MKHIISVLIVVLLLTALTAPASAQQPDAPVLITLDGDGTFFTQTSLDDSPTPLPGQLQDGTFGAALSPDRGTIAQLVIAPEYLTLSDDQKSAITMLPMNIVVIDLPTGDMQTIAGQAANVPDDPWRYRATPVWSPSGSQIAFVEASDIQSAALMLYDVDTQTLTTLPDMLPMGYSDAGMIGWPTAHWSGVGIYSLESNVAPDRLGFAQTLTVVDPTGQLPTQSRTIGRTLSSGAWTTDTVLAAIGAVDSADEPVLLLATAAGEWFIPDMTGYGRRWQTLVLRPAGGGDIEIQFARAIPTEAIQARGGYTSYRAFIRHGDAIFESLNPGVTYTDYLLTHLAQNSGLYAAPDGSSILYQTGDGTYRQWLGPNDIRAVDLGERAILAWGAWVIEAGRNSYVRPYLTMLNGSPTMRVIRAEPVDLHSGPGAATDVIGTLQPGDTFQVLTGPLYADSGHWYEIAIDDNQSGWIELGPNEDRWFAD